MDTISVSVSSNLELAGLNRGQKNNKSKTFNNYAESTTTRQEATLPDQDMKKNIYITFIMFILFIGSGVGSGVLGPTLVHLEYLYETNTAGISIIFIGANAGYFAGTAICAVMFDRFSPELQFGFWGIIAGLSSVLLPWCPQLNMFVAVISIDFLALSMIFAGGQPYMLKLWKGTKYCRSVLQGCNLMWCLGNVLIPFISIPFLSDLSPMNVTSLVKHNSTNSPITSSNMSEMFFNKSVLAQGYYGDTGDNSSLFSKEKINSSSLDINYEQVIDLNELYRVRYIYVIVGLVSIVGGILFFATYIFMKLSSTTAKYSKQSSYEASETSEDDQNNKHPGNSKKQALLKITIVSFVFIFMSFCVWEKNLMCSYLPALAIKHLGWTPQKAALLSSVFYISHTFGAILAVFISRYISSSKLLLSNQILTTLVITMYFFAYINEVIVWGSTALSGFFTSSIFSSLFLWLSDQVTVNSTIGSIFMAATAFGSVLGSWLFGYLFDAYSPMWVIYLSLASSIVCCALFLLLMVLSRLLKHLKGSSSGEVIQVTVKSVNKA